MTKRLNNRSVQIVRSEDIDFANQIRYLFTKIYNFRLAFIAPEERELYQHHEKPIDKKPIGILQSTKIIIIILLGYYFSTIKFIDFI